MSFSGTSLQPQHDQDQEAGSILENSTEAAGFVSSRVVRFRRGCSNRYLIIASLLTISLAVCLSLIIYAVHLSNSSHHDLCSETYNVPNSGRYSWPLHGVSAEVQKYFDQGMLLSFSFNHDEALRSFHVALRVAPQEPMLHWGVAYSLAPNLNRPLTDSNRLHVAQKAVHQMLLAMKSARNIDAETSILLNATAVRFSPRRSVTSSSWVDECDIEYWEVLRRGNATLESPSANFLAILGQAAMETDPWNYYELSFGAKRLKPIMSEANGSLQAALLLDPMHPLALHYSIHLLEVPLPRLESVLNDVADTLSSQFRMKGPGHLTHMPSHAYNRAEQYHKGSDANYHAIAADAEYFKTCKAAGVATYNTYYSSLYFCHKHAVLLSSLQMEGRMADALQILEGLDRDCKIDAVGDNLGGVFSTYSHGVARDVVHLRFGEWSEILLSRAKHELSKHTAFAISFHHIARGIALAEFQECEAARSEQIQFTNISSIVWNDAVFKVKRLGSTTLLVTKGDILTVANLTLSARIAGKCGSPWNDEFSAWNSVIRAAQALPYFEPAFWPLNPSLCLGERLRSRRNFKAAQSVFYEVLGQIRDTSQNGWALFGLWKAIEGEGNLTKADIAEGRFKEAWQYADVLLERACY